MDMKIAAGIPPNEARFQTPALKLATPLGSAVPARSNETASADQSSGRSPGLLRTRPQTLLVVPVAASIGLGVLFFAPGTGIPPTTYFYPTFLCIMLGLGLGAAFVQMCSPALRNWMRRMCPILGVAVLTTVIWQAVTNSLRWLPLPYFPGPEAVMEALRAIEPCFSTAPGIPSLLLLSGYAIGTTLALITGVTIGWFPHARYWGMPLLKLVGPIPATAWIPLAMVVAPSAMFSAVGLVALAVWFPVTMLTASGISNTRASYLDVARTLGSGSGLPYLSGGDSGSAT